MGHSGPYPEMYMSGIDRGLVERVLASEKEAQEEFVELLLPVIHRSAASMLRRWRTGPASAREVRQEVEDMVQEVLLHLFEKNSKVLAAWDSSIRPLETYVSWITRVRTAMVLRSPRSPWREQPIASDEIPERANERTPEDETTLRDLWQRTYLCVVSKQKAKDVLLFDLLYIQELTPREAAEETGGGGVDRIHRWQTRLRAIARRCRDTLLRSEQDNDRPRKSSR